MGKVIVNKVILHIINMKLITPFTTSFGTMNEKQICLVEVVDEDGLSGWGETVASNEPFYNEETTETTVYMLEKFLVPAVIGKEYSHPDEIHNNLSFVRRNNIAKAALETAIWDLFSKKEKVSLATFIGGFKREIEVGKSIGIQETPKMLVEKVEKYVNEGFKKIKVKIKPGFDYAYIREVREQFPDISLMADANSAYTLEQLDEIKKMDEFNLIMIEQPLAHDDIIDHATLQKNIGTPVCLDESIHSLEDTRKAIELGSCQIINIKIGRVGGLGEAIRIHNYCKERSIPVWCGGMLETGVGRAHNIALTTLGNFTIPGDTAPSSHYWHEDIIEPEVVMSDGLISVSQKYGIGYQVNTEILDKFLVRRIVIEK